MEQWIPYLLIRPIGGSDDIGSWDEVPWDGTHSMNHVVNERYPDAFRGGSQFGMERLCKSSPDGRQAVATTGWRRVA